jgi:hypothetical protein
MAVTGPNTDPNNNADEQTKITQAGAVELVEGELDEAAGGVPQSAGIKLEPASLLAKAASGKF